MVMICYQITTQNTPYLTVANTIMTTIWGQKSLSLPKSCLRVGKMLSRTVTAFLWYSNWASINWKRDNLESACKYYYCFGFITSSAHRRKVWNSHLDNPVGVFSFSCNKLQKLRSQSILKEQRASVLKYVNAQFLPIWPVHVAKDSVTVGVFRA